jgi:hypothetical protein
LEFIIDDIFVEVGGIFPINHQHPQENKLNNISQTIYRNEGGRNGRNNGGRNRSTRREPPLSQK